MGKEGRRLPPPADTAQDEQDRMEGETRAGERAGGWQANMGRDTNVHAQCTPLQEEQAEVGVWEVKAGDVG